jgi:hypothetical protein
MSIEEGNKDPRSGGKPKYDGNGTGLSREPSVNK